MQGEDFRTFLSEGLGREILISVLVILAALVLAAVLKRLAGRYIEEPDRRYRASRFIGRLFGILAVVAILYVWYAGRGPDIATILTVIGAGLAIAMREILLSVAAWINIIVRVPYKQGDRIEVNGVQGDVIDIRPLHTVMMETGGWVEADQSTGRIVLVPNAWLYLHGVYNYTRGFRFIWNEIPFTVTFGSDWEAARELMLELASETADIVERQVRKEVAHMSREFLVHYSILTPFAYVRVTPQGIRLSLRYLTEARKRRGTEHALTMSILKAFAEHGGIELTYHTLGMAQVATPQAKRGDSGKYGGAGESAGE